MCGYVRVCVRMCVCVNACVCVCVRGFNCHVMGAQKCGITAQEIRPYAFIKKSPSRRLCLGAKHGLNVSLELSLDGIT